MPVPAPRRAHAALSLLIFEDNGETFPQRVDLETQAGEYSYPSIIHAQDGALHVVD